MNRLVFVLALIALASCKKEKPGTEAPQPVDSTSVGPAYGVTGIKDIHINNNYSAVVLNVGLQQKTGPTTVKMSVVSLPLYAYSLIPQPEQQVPGVSAISFSSRLANPGTYDVSVNTQLPGDTQAIQHPLKLTIEPTEHDDCQRWFFDAFIKGKSQLTFKQGSYTYAVVLAFDAASDEIYLKDMMVMPGSPMGRLLYLYKGTPHIKLGVDCNKRTLTIPTVQVLGEGNPDQPQLFDVSGSGFITPSRDSCSFTLTYSSTVAQNGYRVGDFTVRGKLEW
jgi:hypothetical protein